MNNRNFLWMDGWVLFILATISASSWQANNEEVHFFAAGRETKDKGFGNQSLDTKKNLRFSYTHVYFPNSNAISGFKGALISSCVRTVSFFQSETLEIKCWILPIVFILQAIYWILSKVAKYYFGSTSSSYWNNSYFSAFLYILWY